VDRRPLTPEEWETGRRWLVAHVATLNARHGRDYVAVPDAPDTLDGVLAAWSRPGPVPVYDGHADRTIFDMPAQNYAFRAWHDTCHVRVLGAFDPDGERRTALAQARDVLGSRDLGTATERRLAARMVYDEVTGQVAYLNAHGSFPGDQRAFQRDYTTGRWAGETYP